MIKTCDVLQNKAMYNEELNYNFCSASQANVSEIKMDWINVEVPRKMKGSVSLRGMTWTTCRHQSATMRSDDTKRPYSSLCQVAMLYFIVVSEIQLIKPFIVN